MTLKSKAPIYEAYTIVELAEKLGYSEGTILTFKMGYRKPGRNFARYAATILGKSETELFGESDDD